MAGAGSSRTTDFLPRPMKRVLVWLRGTPLGGPVAVGFRLGYLFYKALQNDKAFIRAAGMSYASLITLVPLLVLVFGMLGQVGVLQDPDEQKMVLDALFGSLFGNVREIREALTPFLSNVDFRALGLVSTGALLVVSARLFLMVERAYCDIFQVRVNRWITKRILNFYFAITMLPLTLVMSIEGAGRFGFGAAQPLLVEGLKFLLLLGALKMLPCVYVRWVPAILGALTSFVLLTLGSRAFAWYLSFSYANPDYPLRAFYGSLILVPIFLVWLYLLWVVVLLGVEVAHVTQNYRGLLDAEVEAAERERGLRTLGLGNALEMMAVVAHHFRSGLGAVSQGVVMQHTGLTGWDVQQLAETFVAAELLVPAPDGWMLARPASQIALSEIADEWRQRAAVPCHNPRTAAEIEAPIVLKGHLADALDRWSFA